MSSKKSRKHAGGKELDWRVIVDRIQHHFQSSTLEKLFSEDSQFIFELVKILYEDVLDSRIKLDMLTIIEQECCGLIHKSSVDQVISALVDIYETEPDNIQATEIKEQLLITITTLFIENNEFMEQELGYSFISKLIELLQKTNNVLNRRLRAMACSCLNEIEDWKPGILWKWKDVLSQLTRNERTDVCHDYLQLLTTVIKNSLGESNVDQEDRGILQTVSYTMDNVSLLTGPGAINVIRSVIWLVKKTPAISPSVFKPFMLQFTPCVDPCILFLMLFIQHKFQGEILSRVEEKMILLKATSAASHGTISTKTRLLIIHWLTSYVQKHKTEWFLEELHQATLPSVFDPLTIHTCKLLLRCLCTPDRRVKDISQDLHYLKQLTETTGGVRVTCALYYILYSHVCLHCSEEVYRTALSITKKLFQKFPHLIPLIVDFLHTLQASQSDRKFPLEILSLLHNSVLSVPLNSLLSNYENFLQVWILSAQDPRMNLQIQLRRMLELAKEAHTRALDDWILGSLLLSICRTMVIFHHTDIFYTQMGDLLYYMMHHFGDPDIQDYTRFLYALLTLTSDKKAKEILNADLVDGLKFGENLANFLPGSMAQVLPSDIHVINDSPIQWLRKQVSVQFTDLKLLADAKIPATDYLTWYTREKSNLKPLIKCELTISMKENVESDNLIGVTLAVNNQQKDLTIEEIHIPFMCKKETVDVDFQCDLHVPVPCALSIRSFFSISRATFQCDLEPFYLSLADFLVPFPWHLLPSEIQRQHMFDALWHHCISDEDENGVESLKIVPYSKDVLRGLWRDAEVVDETRLAENKETGTNCFLFFMAPSYHLLLRAFHRPADTVVEIASDFPRILDYMDDFLDGLVSSH